jgi:hypothetical protein
MGVQIDERQSGTPEHEAGSQVRPFETGARFTDLAERDVTSA